MANYKLPVMNRKITILDQNWAANWNLLVVASFFGVTVAKIRASLLICITGEDWSHIWFHLPFDSCVKLGTESPLAWGTDKKGEERSDQQK